MPDKYKLILIGEGENIEKCRKMVFDLTLDNRVYFLGVRDDVPQILKSVNVIVMSSLYEGLSLSSIEGLASGIPFIASDVDGLREVVENNGLLFPPGDDKKLAETILSVIDNTEFANEIVTRSLLNVEKYSLDNMVKEYYELYKKLV